MSNDPTTIAEIVQDLLSQIESQSEVTDERCFKNIIAMDSSSAYSSSDSDTTTSDCDDKDDGLVRDIRQKMKRLQKKVKAPRRAVLTKKNPDSDEDLPEDEAEEEKANLNQKYLKTKGELTIDDLEPVTRLNIQLDNTVKLVKMGQVISLVDGKLVVIKSLHEGEQQELCKPLNEETILFDSNRRELGKIFEVFGPVQAPFYTIRFNSLNEIKDHSLNVEIGAFIYFAHDMTEYTKFIFNVDELRRIKGSDASWNNDNEPPRDCIEYSDDEEEQMAKRLAKQKRMGNKLKNESDENSEDEIDTNIVLQSQEIAGQRGGKRQAQSNFRKSNSTGFQSNKPNYFRDNNSTRPDFNNNFKQGMMHSQTQYFQNFQSGQQMQNQFMPSIQNQFNSPQYRMNFPQSPQGFMPNFNQNWQQQQNNQRFYNNNSFQGQFYPPQNCGPCFPPQQFYSPPPNFMPNNNYNFQNNWKHQSNNNDNNNNNSNQQQGRFFNHQINDSAPIKSEESHQLIDKRHIQNSSFVKKSF